MVIFLFLTQGIFTQAKNEWKNQKKMALVIGVNNYQPVYTEEDKKSGKKWANISRLNYAVSDSQKIAGALESLQEDYEVILMNDETGKSSEELRPTKINITNKIAKIISKKPDQFLFYFSGHGFQDIKNGKGNILALADTKLVIGKEDNSTSKEIVKSIVTDYQNILILKVDLIDKLKTAKIRTMLLIDACRDEVSLEAGTRSISSELEKFGKLPDDLANADGIWIMLSTAPGTKSHEYPDIQSGLFTYYLEKGLTGGIQNESTEEYITSSNLKKYLSEKMEKHQLKDKDPTDRQGFERCRLHEICLRKTKREKRQTGNDRTLQGTPI